MLAVSFNVLRYLLIGLLSVMTPCYSDYSNLLRPDLAELAMESVYSVYPIHLHCRIALQPAKCMLPV